MSLPKTKPKYTLDINPPKVGTEYMKFGMDRIEELMRKTDTETKYLPRTILLEDLDRGIFDYVNSEKIGLVVEGQKVPVFYIENARWGEYQKTWKFMDDDKNVPTPYILVRRTGKEVGTRLGGKYRIPQPRKFRYLDVPILDDGQVIYLRFKMPEPVNIDLEYEVIFITKFRVDVNFFDEEMLRNFASRQDYIFVKGHPLPIHFEGFQETNPIENIDGDKYYVSKYTLKLLGMIQDEKEFEITKTSRKPRFGYSVE
jgi:hypothetical protein